MGNRLFVASDSGGVYALDPVTGCAYWTFQAVLVTYRLLLSPRSSPDKNRLQNASSEIALGDAFFERFLKLISLSGLDGGRYRTRTYDLVRVKHAL